MAIVVEQLESRERTWAQESESILRFFVDGTSDDQIAEALVNAAAPTTYRSLYKQSIRTRPGEGPTRWYGEVAYGARPRGQPGDYEWQLEIGGATIHITQAISVVNFFAPPGLPHVDSHGAINIGKDGDIEGTDIEAPTLDWSETHYFAAEAFTFAYIYTLYQLRSTVNTATFRGFPPESVLFRGASAAPKGLDTVAITFRFSAAPEVADQTIDTITGVSKKGWEYLWTLYEDVVDAVAKKLGRKPREVFVDQVYMLGDFTRLGIPEIWS
jgi:hypothetical protein